MRRLLPVVSLVAVSFAGEAKELPKVSDVISEKVSALPPPRPPAVPKGVVMAISSSDERAQKAVRDGMVCLHTGWDFQAYRHFCMALKADPDCLMAHWGAALSLMHGHPDMRTAREAALDRMLALLDQGVGTDLEKRYALSLAKLVSEGVQPAAEGLIAAAREFPGDPQLTLLKSLLSRGGYDSTGEATPDQQRAEEEMRAAIGRHPDLTWLRYGYLAMRAEAPSLREHLDLARQLVADAPDYAPYFHLLGHYEWRCGNHARAIIAFDRAADLYIEWQRSNGLLAVDCPAWTKAESYRAVALASKGDYETALAIADALAAIEVPLEAADSNGGRMLMWEGKTLPVRILMRRGGPGDMARAAKVLPPFDEVKEFGRKSLALWSYQIHSSVVAGRIAIDMGDLDAAREISADVSRIGENYVKTREIADRAGERSFWLRGFKAFEVMASELRGLIAMAGPPDDRGSAFNWFRSAADRQQRASLMMPPAVLLPMECRLADYHADRKQIDEAVEVLHAGLESYPEDLELLARLLSLYESRADEAEAAGIRKRIEAVSGS